MNLLMPEAYTLTVREMLWQWLYVASLCMCVGKLVGAMFCEDIFCWNPRSFTSHCTKGALVILEAMGIFTLTPAAWFSIHTAMLIAATPDTLSFYGTFFSALVLWPASLVLMMHALAYERPIRRSVG